MYLFFLLINFCLYIFVICLLRYGPPRLAFASCGHVLSVNRSRKIKMCVCGSSELFLEGGDGIFGFVDLSKFWFGFSVFALRFFGFGVLPGLQVFSNLVNLICGNTDVKLRCDHRSCNRN